MDWNARDGIMDLYQFMLDDKRSDDDNDNNESEDDSRYGNDCHQHQYDSIEIK